MPEHLSITAPALDDAVPLEAPQPGADRDGTAWAAEGVIHVRGPAGSGRPARISAGLHLTLWINGQPRSGMVEVLPEDRIELKSVDTPPESGVTVQVSPDGMTATGCRIRRPGVRYTVADRPETTVLECAADAVPVGEVPLTDAQISAALADARVIRGLKDGITEQLQRAADGEQLVVAHGQCGTPPVDEQLDLRFGTEDVSVTEDAVIDHRERHQIPAVFRGDVLAIQTPGIPGTPEITVTGKVREPSAPRRVRIRAADGVATSEDGTRFLADLDGQPVFRQGVLRVLPVHEVRNVDLETGNIRFTGTVRVRKDVADGMVVEAREDIWVGGNTSMSRVLAGGNLHVEHNAIGCVLTAGGTDAELLHLLRLLRETVQMLDGLAGDLSATLAAGQQKDRADGVREGALIKLLLEKRYPEAARTARAAAALAAAVDAPPQNTAEFSATLRAALTGLGPVSLTAGRLDKLRKKGAEVIGVLAVASECAADIRVSYAQNSELEASGSIQITGRGAYNSRLQAGDAVRISGMPGVCRGGEISAGTLVEVGELGSPSGAPTTVVIGEGGRVRARVAHPNVTIRSGPYLHRTRTGSRMLEIRATAGGLEVTEHRSGERG